MSKKVKQDSDSEDLPSLYFSDDSLSNLSDETENEAFDQLEETYMQKKLPEIDPVYESDTSDEEHENTVGNIPMRWYDEYDHIGYTKEGEKISKQVTRDEVDKFLENADNPEIWQSVFDEMAGKHVKLTREDLEIIQKIQNQQFPDEVNPYEPLVEFFSSRTEVMPLSSAPEPKRRFIPSKHEAQRIMKIARAIRKGWMTPKSSKKEDKVYDLWGQSREEVVPNIMHIPAPKVALPGNEESYNPPEEYLKTPEEIEKEQALEDDPIFIPKKYKSLRLVPAYENYIRDRFNRCLDLYLCPRMIKKRIQVDPESLLPKLPDPKDLEPFPSQLAVVYTGHEGKVLGISVDPTGFWLASIAEDKTLRVWEVRTGRCCKVISLKDTPQCVAWNPNKDVHLLSVAVGEHIMVLNPGVGNRAVREATDVLLHQDCQSKASHAKWTVAKDKSILIQTSKPVSYLHWHRKGDYFASIAPEGSNSSVLIHQLSKRESQAPFSRSKGMITSVVFHPNKPFFFAATQRNVRVYNLLKQEMVKKLISGVKWISSMDIHPSGDHIIIGSFDKRLCWFDLDLSSTPYKTLRYNQRAVRSVSFHKKYPLFASCSDDGSVNLFHSMVYNDLMQNPLIVPLKKLKAHQEQDGLGSVNVMFHPHQPWLFSCGVDGLIKLFS